MGGTQSVPKQEWGEWRSGECNSKGEKKHSSVLWNIPRGEDWEAACKNMDTPWGRKPNKCVNTGSQMWGEVWEPSSDCGTHKKTTSPGWMTKAADNYKKDQAGGTCPPCKCDNCVAADERIVVSNDMYTRGILRNR